MNKKEYVFIGGRMQGKTRDLIHQLIQENKQLKEQLQQSDEVIEEALEKLSFVDDALDENILNTSLCIVKINKTIDILNKYKNKENR